MDQQRSSIPTLNDLSLSSRASPMVGRKDSTQKSVPNRLYTAKKSSAPALQCSITTPDGAVCARTLSRMTQSMNNSFSHETPNGAESAMNGKQKKKSVDNMIKTFKFLKRVSTDLTIWKGKTGAKPHIGTCSTRQTSSSVDADVPNGEAVASCSDLHLQHFAAGYRKNETLKAKAHLCSSASAIAEASSTKTTSSPTSPYAKLLAEHQPSAAQVRSWGSSFQALLDNACGLEMFREFLRSEFSDENLDFWIACKQYRQSAEVNCHSLGQKAHNLFEHYLQDHSHKEVNLDSETRQRTVSSLLNGSFDLNTFAEAQQRIYTLMEKDSYRRFLQSDVYRQLLLNHCNASSTSDISNCDSIIS